MGERIAIIVAGGSGVRMGSDTPKQFLPLRGKPVIVHAIEKFAGLADRIVVVLPEAAHGTGADLSAALPTVDMEICAGGTTRFADASGFDLTAALPKDINVEICPGGRTRFESVRNALKHITHSERPEADTASGASCDQTPQMATSPARRHRDPRTIGPPRTTPQLIAIHDGVRPLVDRDLVAKAFDEAATHGTAVPYTAPVDSFRLDGAHVDRSKLMAIQTPQAFRAEILLDAYSRSDEGFTDDASVVEAAGHTLHFFEGDRKNIKITTPADLLIAEALCE